MNANRLGSLNNPDLHNEHIDISDYCKKDLLNHLKNMIRIRMVEDYLAVMKRDGFIGGPVHLGAGQEAIAVGVSTHLTPADKVFSTHRSHAHLLALGASLHGLFAEVLGKDSGLSRGMGGSMHLVCEPIGFYGSVPIVGGTIALAVGAALGEKLLNKNGVGLAYFGDGAAEEGVFHESMNLASQMNLPVLFVVENNLFASHLHITQRQPCNSISRFAEAHNIDFQVVDGNDVVSVARASRKLIDNARVHGSPGLLEAITYRRYGHVDWREDIDVGVNRSADDMGKWRKRDPIKRLFNSLELNGISNHDAILELEEGFKLEIESAWRKAVEDPYPNGGELLNRVYRS